jgi:hypothetical protein
VLLGELLFILKQGLEKLLDVLSHCNALFHFLGALPLSCLFKKQYLLRKSHSDYRTVSPTSFRRVDSGSFGTRLIIFGRNENLVQNQLFALTKLNIYKQTVKISATAAAAVQKKGT